MTHTQKTIAITDMKISKLNMRHGKDAPNIDDIYPSILEKGVHQSLLVRKEGEFWGIIAGRRRYFALVRKSQETGKKIKAPCLIMQSGDNADAIEASLLENIARVPADEMQQYTTYKKLADAKKTVDQIATTFGITPLKVKRILALADLKPELRRLYADEKIGVNTIRALTLASKTQQTAWLKLFKDEDEYTPQGDNLKSWLTGGYSISTETAVFDVAAYEGVIITDLFGENALFQDPDYFWKCQNAAIAEKIAAYKKQGWKDIVILERGHHFSSWAYGKRAKDSGGKIFVETHSDGVVNFHEGFLSHEDIKKIDVILNGPDAEAKTTKSDRPEMSGPLDSYVSLHRHALARAALLAQPQTALRLSVAHMIGGSSLWAVDAHKFASVAAATRESVESSKASEAFLAEREAVRAMLGIHSEDAGLVDVGYDHDTTLTVFIKLLDFSDADVMRVLTVAMADSLSPHSGAVEAIAQVIDVDMPNKWAPDDAFFEILRDKRVINAMVADIAGKRTADASLTDTGKAQKTIIRNRIAGHGAEPNTDWRPRWMQFPARSYLDDQGTPARASQSVRKLFKKFAAKSTDKVSRKGGKVLALKKVA